MKNLVEARLQLRENPTLNTLSEIKAILELENGANPVQIASILVEYDDLATDVKNVIDPDGLFREYVNHKFKESKEALAYPKWSNTDSVHKSVGYAELKRRKIAYSSKHFTYR